MKKSLVMSFVFAVLVVCGSSNAALAASGWAGTAAVNFSSYGNNSGANTTMDLGFSVGGNYIYPLNSNSMFITGLSFTADNAKIGDSKLKMQSIRVPLLYGYAINQNWHVLGGGYLGYILKFEGEVAGTTVDFTDNTNRFDYGLTAGAGYLYNNNWCFDLTYSLGLANLSKNSGVFSAVRTLAVSASYLF